LLRNPTVHFRLSSLKSGGFLAAFSVASVFCPLPAEGRQQETKAWTTFPRYILSSSNAITYKPYPRAVGFLRGRRAKH
jgi:hypothetical protein